MNLLKSVNDNVSYVAGDDSEQESSKGKSIWFPQLMHVFAHSAPSIQDEGACLLSQRGVLLLTSSTVRHDTQKCIQYVMTPTVFHEHIAWRTTIVILY